MSKPHPRYSQYFYHASAYGLAGEIERPVRQTIPAQAASVLAGHGGRGNSSVEKFDFPPFLYCEAAYTEVGGSYDEDHNKHTTYATAVVEGLNVADVLTADRVVCRLVIYSPEIGKPGEHSYSFTGSHFDNLRVGGQKIDVDLATHTLHEYDTYSGFEKAYAGGKEAGLHPWGDQSDSGLNELEQHEEQYNALSGIGARAKAWKKKPTRNSTYWCSLAGHLKLPPKGTELKNYGSIILVPKFGVVRLAEMLVSPEYRRLTMFRVDMCSGTTGSGSGGTGMGSGGSPPGG